LGSNAFLSYSDSNVDKGGDELLCIPSDKSPAPLRT
jgi:hypothetical protein